ncbi:hypothetical protein F5Y19DRAFT_454592 [Xylariaceae sp. FL1651]|nr:hypothetical protein F5Y19DRAFT_454592 [Xylariaceae sp. FL1651]
MVQSSIIAIALTAAFSGFAAAKSCKTGGIYCGTSLLNRGNYITNINTGLAAQSLPQTEFNQHNSLWDCTHNGQVQFSTLCLMGCLPNGSNDDTCQVDTAKRDAGDAAGETTAAKRDAVGKEWVA